MKSKQKSPTFAAFNQGQTPTIACFNKAKTPLGMDFGQLIQAMQTYVDEHVAPVWGTPAKLAQTTGFLKDSWAMVFLDDADAPGALAYHDLTPEGMPLAKIFVKTTLASHDSVSVSASHELVEMLVDPAINLAAMGARQDVLYAYESADPVEALSFNVDGIPMSDFVYPAYFESFHKPGTVKFDHLGKVKKPYEILKGGYQIVFKNGKWGQIYGSKEKEKAFAGEDRRGHRSEQRRKNASRLLSTSDLQKPNPGKREEEEQQVEKKAATPTPPKPAENLYQVLAETERSIQLLTSLYAQTANGQHTGVGGKPILTPQQELIKQQLADAQARYDRILKILEKSTV